MNNTLSTTEELYATMPMNAVHVSSSACSDEEEVYTSFEQAISARLIALHGYHTRSNASTRTMSYTPQQTGPIVRDCFSTSQIPYSYSPNAPEVHNVPGVQETIKHTKRNVLLICFAIMCVLAGFDLMGLLILHLR
jgi:hypothetical protein